MAQQQQQQQQQQWAGAQPIYASPAAFNPATSSYPGSNGISAPQTPVQGQQYGGGAPYQGGGQPGAPSYPPQQQQQQQQTPNNMHEAQQAALRGMNLQGLTPEKWASLPPQQQQMLRQMLQARQQSALGMGYPASPAGGQGGMPNGSPTPMGGAGSPVGPAPGGYQQGGARPPSQGQPPNTPQGQGQQPSPATSGFLKTLSDFYAKRGQPFPGQPVIDGRTVDLSILYQRTPCSCSAFQDGRADPPSHSQSSFAEVDSNRLVVVLSPSRAPKTNPFSSHSVINSSFGGRFWAHSAFQ